MENKDTFSTDSFILAAYLLCESIPLLSIDRGNPKRMIFIFEESTKRMRLEKKFLSYQSLVEPNRFHSASKNLKQIIYQQGIVKGSTVMSD